MKFIIAIIASMVIAVLVYYFNSKSEAPSVVLASTVSAESSPKAYLTASYKMNVQGRDFNLKMVYDFPNTDICQAQFNSSESSSMISTFKQRCDNDSVCQAAEVSSCSTFTDQKYKDMLDKNYHDTHYIHISDPKIANQRGVIVFWGLNESEASGMCDHMKKGNRTINPLIIECL